MRTVEQIVEQVRIDAGADFAFVLTRKGRLVTSRAPRDMPEEGRDRILRAARPIVGTDRVVELTLPREDLVPYGGAAPVDVYIGVAAEQAILCVVMASWADKIRVAPALAVGMKDIEPLLRRGLASRRATDLAPAKGSPFPGRSSLAETGKPAAPTAEPPPESAFHPIHPGIDAPPRRAAIQASAPEIHVAEAELGKLSMVAIRHEVAAGGSIPEITYSETELGRHSAVAVRRDLIASASAPEIVVTGEAAIGRETMVAIDQDTKPRYASTPEAIRIDLVSMPDLDPEELGQSRGTVPWVELPTDSKRAAEAAVAGRNMAPPKVTVKLDEADADVLAAAAAEASPAPPPRPPQVTRAYEPPPAPKTAKR